MLKKSLLIILFSGFAGHASGETNGVWVEAYRGCNLHLSLEEMARLPKTGGDTYLAKTIFQLNDFRYAVDLYSGDGCHSLENGILVRDGANLKCLNEEYYSKGIFRHISGNEYHFEMSIYGGHAYGFLAKKIDLEIFGSTLKVSTDKGSECDGSMIQYYIPYPMS